MLPVNCGSHADYQNFVVTNLRKYYPDPDALARDIWDIIDRFWNLDLSYTDEMMKYKYSKFDPAPRTPSCMQRSHLLSIDIKVTSITKWTAQLKKNPLYVILNGFEVDVKSARKRKHLVCDCLEKGQGITDCDCNRFFSQPDCDIGWNHCIIVFITATIYICS